jgi:hypothetical protein
MALFSGLNSSAVSRLKQTWALIDSKKLKILQELELIFTPTHNFKNYRANLESCDTAVDTTVVPVVSIFVKDLTFMNDGNNKYTEPGMVNFGKTRSMHTSTVEFLRFARRESSSSHKGRRESSSKQGNFVVPGFDPVHHKFVMNMVENIRSLRDKDEVIYKYSLICEPRVAAS